MRIILLFILFSSVITHSDWVRVSNGMGNNISVTSITTIGNNIFAGTRNAGVFLSTNFGLNWSQTSLDGFWITSLSSNGNTIYAASIGIFASSNNGVNWSFLNLYDRAVYSIAINGNSIFAGTTDLSNNPYGIYVTKNNGANWSQTSLTNRIVYSFTTDSSNIFAGTGNPGLGVYKSTNSGKVWTQTSLNNQDIRALAIHGNYVFAGTYDNTLSNPHGLYISSNYGNDWIQSTLNNVNIYALSVKDDHIFAGGELGSKFFVSSDNGTNWIPWSTGINSNAVLSICILNNYVYAGSFNNGIYRRSLNELVDIQPISIEIPQQFSLSQNYPNPFNPVTNINFSIPKAGLTSIRIYDINGRLITTLLEEHLSPGSYKTDWNAVEMPSGIYIYRIESGSFTQSRKMILIK